MSNPYVEQHHQPLADYVAFRCAKPMARALRTEALTHKVDVSTVIRLLIEEGAKQRGLNLQVF